MRGIIHIMPGVASGYAMLLKTLPFPYWLVIKKVVVGHVFRGIALFVNIALHYGKSFVLDGVACGRYKNRPS